MKTQRGLLSALLLALAASALPPQASAGSADAPEVTDPAGDPVFMDDAPACPNGVCVGPPQFIDLTMGWVGAETATDILLWMDVAGNANANAYGSAQFDFHFTVAGTEYVAGFNVRWANVNGGVPGSGAVTPTGVASAAAYEEAALVLTVPRSAIGDPAPGATMTGLYVTSSLSLAEQADGAWTDRAPSGDGFGSDYTFTAGPSMGAPGDTDSDGLNDTWEQEQFGNATAQNGSSDPDGDGLNNTAEQALGTNATNPDTDGDGITDGQEVADGTDPLVPDLEDVVDGNATGNGTADDGATGDTGQDADSDGEKSKLDEYMDAVRADTGYAGASAAGMGAVLLLSIVGLAGRWGL